MTKLSQAFKFLRAIQESKELRNFANKWQTKVKKPNKNVVSNHKSKDKNNREKKIAKTAQTTTFGTKRQKSKQMTTCSQ